MPKNHYLDGVLYPYYVSIIIWGHIEKCVAVFEYMLACLVVNLTAQFVTTRCDIWFQVMYVEGTAVIMEMPELQIITDSSSIKMCLLTKWPTIELKWKDNFIPSLN